MICFHHNDLDGRCAAAIVNKFYKGIKSLKFIELDHNMEIPLDKVAKDEKVYIVDFAFKPPVMEKLLQITKNVIWVDHHKTAFEYADEYSVELRGLRDAKYAGCELTWMFLYKGYKIPEAVKLIGDRDKWAWKFGKRTALFNIGLESFPHAPTDKIWDPLLRNNLGMLEKVMGDGEICLRFRDAFCENYRNSYAFEIEFEGYKCLALNLYDYGSEAFGDRFKDYDICMSFIYNGENFKIGLYSEKVDVSKICQKYGGGGHTGAGGFVVKELPFKSK